MFNTFPTFAFAGAAELPARDSIPGSTSDSPLSSRVQAMLGRGLGRGAPPAGASPATVPPVGVPSHSGAPHSTPAPAHPAPGQTAPGQAGLPPEFLDYVEAMGQNIAFLREQLGEMRGEVSTLSARGADSAKVFDVLHAELGDYKRDFIFAHIKPLLRPLLFLYDSLEGFDGEMKLYEDAQSGQTLPGDALRGAKVRGNIAFLRDQLIEALSVCEVEPIPLPSGKFDAHFQKAIETVSVAPEHDGEIVRVIRLGWTLNGQVLRPAEVVVGKADTHSKGGPV